MFPRLKKRAPIEATAGVPRTGRALCSFNKDRTAETLNAPRPLKGPQRHQRPQRLSDSNTPAIPPSPAPHAPRDEANPPAAGACLSSPPAIHSTLPHRIAAVPGKTAAARVLPPPVAQSSPRPGRPARGRGELPIEPEKPPTAQIRPPRRKYAFPRPGNAFPRLGNARPRPGSPPPAPDLPSHRPGMPAAGPGTHSPRPGRLATAQLSPSPGQEGLPPAAPQGHGPSADRPGRRTATQARPTRPHPWTEKESLSNLQPRRAIPLLPNRLTSQLPSSLTPAFPYSHTPTPKRGSS